MSSVYFKWPSLFSASAFFGVDGRLSNLEVTQDLWPYGFRWGGKEIKSPMTKSTSTVYDLKTHLVCFGWDFFEATHTARLCATSRALYKRKSWTSTCDHRNVSEEKKTTTYRHKIESFQRLLTGLIQRCLQICGMWFKCKNRRTNMKPCEEQGRHKKKILGANHTSLFDWQRFALNLVFSSC